MRDRNVFDVEVIQELLQAADWHCDLLSPQIFAPVLIVKHRPKICIEDVMEKTKISAGQKHLFS